MDYSEINSMLSGIEINTENILEQTPSVDIKEKIQTLDMIKESTKIDLKDDKKNNDIIEDKNKTNNLLCFRDIEFKKHKDQFSDHKLENNTKKDDINYNKKLNDRMFDLNNNNMPPIMDFYP